MSSEAQADGVMHEDDLLEGIRSALDDGNRQTLRERLQDLPAPDDASALSELEQDEQALIFRLLDTEAQAAGLGELDPDSVRYIAEWGLDGYRKPSA